MGITEARLLAQHPVSGAFSKSGSVTTATTGRRSSHLVRVGVDVVPVEEVALSVRSFGVRYLRRLFTEHEISCCGGEREPSAESLAARFAAKEATLKVLRPQAEVPSWRSIEVRRDPSGWCELRLYGAAEDLASQQAITDISVSLSHEAGMGVAVVVALCEPCGREGEMNEAFDAGSPR